MQLLVVVNSTIEIPTSHTPTFLPHHIPTPNPAPLAPPDRLAYPYPPLNRLGICGLGSWAKGTGFLRLGEPAGGIPGGTRRSPGFFRPVFK